MCVCMVGVCDAGREREKDGARAAGESERWSLAPGRKGRLDDNCLLSI